MKELIDGLNTRLNITLQSTSERDFYMSLYYYFDYVHKTSSLIKIFDKSEKEYSKAFNDIWKEKKQYTEEELDEKSSQVVKLERFNLFAVGSTILVRIYLPIDDYKNTSEPDEKQDPVAIILIHGIDYALELGKRDKYLNLTRWNKEFLRSYRNWFEGKRNYYESIIRRFHLMFLDELSKPILEINIKKEIYFDKENSLIKIGDKIINIKLKNDKPNSHYVLEYIFENEEGFKAQSFYTDIIESKFSNENIEWRSIYRACNDINKKVSEQASISNFLIVKTGKSGYTQINPEFL
ncbi:MAG: hypothetical protein PHN69_02690 [Candidatus Pacebacteria bacterium]|nr:hypothetical protein [Candidatus Paceibacterota bacterium]